MVPFDELNICQELKDRLKKSNFITATEIQAKVLEHILKGKDVIGSAKTGSGKTLAFVIPMLNILITNKITRWDGVQVIILCPTRELAYQTYTTINSVFGVPINKMQLDLSIGLSIGGKDCRTEKEYISRNILVCTPGRLKDHIETNPYFNCDSFQLLIVDEADQMVDPGFIRDVTHIIENLPKSHQKLVFSATLSDSVMVLCKHLQLKKPVCVSVDQENEGKSVKTPDLLIQSYIICPLHEKLNFLYSFLKGNRGSKILVFMASCKQVKYVHELLLKLDNGSLKTNALYGTLSQMRRMEIYDDFRRKQNAVLLATDIAARGLDFPSVDWVLQLDSPCDFKTYIHRAGRTARANKGGQSVLVLLPSEEAFLSKLAQRNIQIKEFKFHHRPLVIHKRAATYCAMIKELKESAQRAFKSYLKSIYLMQDKQIFNFKALDRELFAKSLGLSAAPRVRLLEKMKPGGNLGGKKKIDETHSQPEQSGQSDSRKYVHHESARTTYASSTKSGQVSLMCGDASDDDSDGDGDQLFHVKNTWKFDGSDKNDLPIEAPEEPIDLESISRRKKSDKAITKAALAKKLMKKKIKPNSKITFDEDGNAIQEISQMKATSEKAKLLEQINKNRDGGGIDIELAREVLREEDVIDKQLQRNLVKQKHREMRIKQKEAKRKQSDRARGPAARLAAGDDADAFDTDDDDQLYDGETSNYIDQLPDPEKVYSKTNSDLDDSDQDYSRQDGQEDEHRGRQDKRDVPSSDSESGSPARKLLRNNSEDNLDLVDNEALALHILRAIE